MKRIFSALVLVTLSVAACGGDDDDDNNDNTAGTSGSGSGGVPGTGDGGEQSGSPGGVPALGGAPATGNVPCDPELDGVCQNPMDCPFVASGEARLVAGGCGRDCLTTGNTDEACPGDCLLEAIEISPECGQCYADAAVCGIMECAADCIADPEAEVCQACLVESGCREAFNTCSGLTE